MDFFIKHLKVNRDGVWIMMMMQGGMFVFGVLIVVCINAFVNEDRDYAAIGSLMALIGTVFGGLIRGNGGAYRYNMAVSMGQTRRFYMLADPVLTMMNSVIGIAFAWVLNKFELWMYTLLYPGWEMDFDVFSELEWWYALIFIAGICVADFCFGALQLKFGAKGFAGAAASDTLSVAKTADIAAHLIKLPWWLAAAVPVSLGADIVFQWLLLRQREVKL